MRHALCGLAFLLLLSAPAAALGDSVYNLNGTLQDGTGVFNGTLDIDSQGVGYVQGTLTDGSFSFTLPTNYLGEELGEPPYLLIDVFAVTSNFDLTLFLPDALLASGMGGPLCSLTTVCPFEVPVFGEPPRLVDSSSSFYDGPIEQNFLDITATPASAVTPEPGTLALFGTGLLATVGLMRRRARG